MRPLLAALVLLSRSPAAETPVRATLDDGQVLMGEVRTRTLRLATGSGEVAIPLDDVGEVVPADGEALGHSEGKVTVWLRNGSELRGTWVEPTLAMDVAVGRVEVPVDLPMADLSRLQLQGGAQWPTGPVVRLRTAFGDDLLVDPARTVLTLDNDFGSFSPRLADCARVEPLGEPTGPWRVELNTGTVLIGALRGDRLTVALPMGPEQLTVALRDFESLRAEVWRPVAAAPVVYAAVAESGGRRARPQAEEAAAPAPSDWFDRAPMQASKDAMP
jgi:hypothetical protein